MFGCRVDQRIRDGLVNPTSFDGKRKRFGKPTSFITMSCFHQRVSKHSSQCEIMNPLSGGLSPVKAPGRTKIGAADEG